MATDRSILASWMCTAALLAAASGAAQEPGPGEVSPRLFGLETPDGPVVASRGERVLTQDGQGAEVVARLHVQVGPHRIVLLPDGQLVARSEAASPPTDRPFAPLPIEALAQRLTRTEFPGFKDRQTRHYLCVFNGSEAYAEATGRILETMLRGVLAYAQAQKLPVTEPPLPLPVIIFRTGDEFHRYRPMPEGVVAYYDVLSNRVVMCEESKLWPLKPELAIRQAIATVAHEGAHQILHNIGVQQRLSVWPMWLSEGLAEFFSPTSADRQMKWKGAGEVNELRMYELEQWLRSREGQAIDGQLVAQTVTAAKLTSTGYATAWGLTHYLAKNHREAFHALLREASRQSPLTSPGATLPPGIIPENLRTFKQHFGEDLAALERRLILYLQKLPYADPFADLPHAVALFAVATAGKLQRQARVFASVQQADAWRRERLAETPADRRDTAIHAVREFPNRLQAEQYARQWLNQP